jgi:phosphatidylserine/phosphatidylglycerophosphate/cardiolipin synthase-like enzyme
LAEAQAFVHFVSWGLSDEFLGALKLIAAKGISVRGIVTNASKYIVDQLDESWVAFGGLHIRAFGEADSRDKPHVKLIVVDGLLCFTGSTNLTTSGWRKVANDFDMVMPLTEPDRIAELNNRYFAKAWLQYGVYDFFFPTLGPEVPMHWY